MILIGILRQSAISISDFGRSRGFVRRPFCISTGLILRWFVAVRQFLIEGILVPQAYIPFKGNIGNIGGYFKVILRLFLSSVKAI